MTALQPSEAAFQAAVVDLARLRGWLVFHAHDSRRGLGAGFPDLVLLHERTGELLFVELKKHDGRVSPDQQRWHAALLRGQHRFHLWRPIHLRNGAVARALTPADLRRLA